MFGRWAPRVKCTLQPAGMKIAAILRVYHGCASANGRKIATVVQYSDLRVGRPERPCPVLRMRRILTNSAWLECGRVAFQTCLSTEMGRIIRPWLQAQTAWQQARELAAGIGPEDNRMLRIGRATCSQATGGRS